MRLYGYWRSTAAYRVRIALALKGIDYETVPVDLRANEQAAAGYGAVNAHRLVPVLADGEARLTQSLAICEYLDESHPRPPLLPAAPAARARVRAIAQAIACEIHPLNNLRVLKYLGDELGIDEPDRLAWYRHWIHTGFRSLEAELAASPHTGRCCHGDDVTLADLCLVPQVYNADRFEVDLAAYPVIRRINEHCLGLEAFEGARPENQPDAA